MPRESGASSKHRPSLYLKSLWLLDRPLSRAMTTAGVVGAHAVYNYKPGAFFGVDERARVLVQLQKGKWTLLQ